MLWGRQGHLEGMAGLAVGKSASVKPDRCKERSEACVDEEVEAEGGRVGDVAERKAWATLQGTGRGRRCREQGVGDIVEKKGWLMLQRRRGIDWRICSRH